MKKTCMLVARLLAGSLGLILAGCGSAPVAEPAEEPVRADPQAAVAAVRAAGGELDSAVQVAPLRDPAIEGWVAEARAAEAAGDHARAEAALERALRLAPDAPDLLQDRAEVALLRGHWREAEELAVRSFNLGPRVGSLCARNWQTSVEARVAFGDAEGALAAQERLRACRVPPRIRM